MYKYGTVAILIILFLILTSNMAFADIAAPTLNSGATIFIYVICIIVAVFVAIAIIKYIKSLHKKAK